MLSANTIVPILQYNASLDTASFVYEIPVGVSLVSLLSPSLGTSVNSEVTVIKSGLQYAVPSLNSPAVSNFYSAAYNATSTGLLLTGSSAVALDLAADGDNSQGDAVLITKEISTVITDTAKTSVVLPVISPLVAYTIYNKGTLALNIFPAVDDYINGLAQDAAYVLAVGAKVTFYAKATAVADTEGFGWNVIS